ncbi:MAG: glycosyltransferase [Candidatus Magasanikbacteria bacterium]|nr:glycosyltransferase [Candidatus Magasanikbacteria bacterium]
MKLTVQLVVWNGEKYIPYLFESLRAQTFKDWDLLIFDNNSTDNIINKIQKELNNFSVQNKFIKSKENIGFAGGHNLLYAKNDSEYILLLNQDMYLEKDCFSKLVEYLDKNEKTASSSPRLMRWNFGDVEKGLENSFGENIDTLGLKVFRSRRVVDTFAQQKWGEVKTKFNGKNDVEVFGVSGALPIYRRSALKVVEENGLIFDTLFGSYKEDVDLAFRLCSVGFNAAVILNVVAYHDRSGTGSKDYSDKSAIKNKKKQSTQLSYQSYKNHIMILLKNEYWQNFLLDFIWILCYELKKFVYYFLFNRKNLKGLKEIWENRNIILNRRKEIKQNRKVDWREMRRKHDIKNKLKINTLS